MAPSSRTSSQSYAQKHPVISSPQDNSRMFQNLLPVEREWQEHRQPTWTSSFCAREGIEGSSSLMIPRHAIERQPETPTQQSKKSAPLRPSAEKYNRHSRPQRQRSPAVPESELNTSKLAVAFPDFSGYSQDSNSHQPFSPNPFSTTKTADQGSEDGKKTRIKNASSSHHLNARVRDENDNSIVSEGRPSIDLTSKNTRYGGIHSLKTRKGPQPHIFKPTPGLVQNTAVTSTGAIKPMAITAHGTLSSIPDGSSRQTVYLPHGPNLTDLFSGTISQTPHVVENRLRASRFASSSKQQAAAQPKPEEVPVPIVERDLLRSIDILQDKVFELEKIRGGLEQVNSDREKKNYELTLEIEQIKSGQRSDSALGMTDDGSDRGEGKGPARRQLTIEKNRLESIVWSLRKDIDHMKRDAASADATIKNVVVERNNAVTQLANSEHRLDRLNDQREMLLRENAELKSEVARLSQEHGYYDTLKHENESLRAEIARLLDISNKHDAFMLNKEVLNAISADYSHANSSKAGVSPAKAQNKETLSAHHSAVTMDSFVSKGKIQENNHEEVPVSKKPVQKAQYQLDNTSESSHNITNLSYDGEAPFYQIRKTLEQERLARHKLRRNRHSLPQEDMTSGFILPDITLRQPIVEAQATIQQVVSTNLKSTDHDLTLDNPAILDAKQEIVEHASPTVTDQELDLTTYDEEPSERPSQPSAEALAAVMKSLREELAEQKAQLDLYQSNYNKFDAAMNKRQRKRVYAKIQDILKAADNKADQIYSLEDVIQGHQKDDQRITQEQIDNTLQSLGLDLPWEGIESTTASRRHSTSTSRSI